MPLTLHGQGGKVSFGLTSPFEKVLGNHGRRVLWTKEDKHSLLPAGGGAMAWTLTHPREHLYNSVSLEWKSMGTRPACWRCVAHYQAQIRQNKNRDLGLLSESYIKERTSTTCVLTLKITEWEKVMQHNDSNVSTHDASIKFRMIVKIFVKERLSGWSLKYLIVVLYSVTSG